MQKSKISILQAMVNKNTCQGNSFQTCGSIIVRDFFVCFFKDIRFVITGKM
jgi:hypothetical protein